MPAKSSTLRGVSLSRNDIDFSSLGWPIARPIIPQRRRASTITEVRALDADFTPAIAHVLSLSEAFGTAVSLLEGTLAVHTSR